jgi:tetratricopeptide (TPR) repeat protein
MLPLLLALALAVPPDAAAPASAPVDQKAKAVFSVAKKLFGQKRYAEAIVKFQEAYADTAHPVILYNIGKCHERLGDPALALRHFREYARLDPQAASDAAVKGDLANAERRLRESGLQQLVVFTDPANARITMDGKPLSPSPAYVELGPGAHSVTVSAEGYETEERPFVMAITRMSELTVNLRPRAPAAAPLASDAPTEPSTASLRPSTESLPPDFVATKDAPAPRPRVGTWVSAGVAVAAAAVATGFGVSALNAQSALSTTDESRTRDQANALTAQASTGALGANISWGVAGAAAITATVLFFVEGARR